MTKHLKVSLATAVLYIVLGLLLAFFDGWYSFVHGFFESTVVDYLTLSISYYGMILAALVSAITGLMAAYFALRTHSKWWYAVTIYAAANILIVFGSAFVFFTT